MSEQPTPTKLAAADEADPDAGDAPGARAHEGVVGVVGHSNQLNQPFFAGRRGDAAPGADAYACGPDGGAPEDPASSYESAKGLLVTSRLAASRSAPSGPEAERAGQLRLGLSGRKAAAALRAADGGGSGQRGPVGSTLALARAEAGRNRATARGEALVAGAAGPASGAAARDPVRARAEARARIARMRMP